MKKMTLLWILLILSIWINGLEIAYENNLIEISGDFEIKEFIIKTIAEEEFYQPIIAQCTNGGKIGEAEIPSCSKFVSLPNNGNFVINSLVGKEFNLNKRSVMFFDLRLTWAGGRRYTPVNLEGSIANNSAFYNMVYFEDQAYSKQFANYCKADLKKDASH